MLTLPQGMHVFERGWLSSNNILCLDQDSATLIDSGYCTHAPQTLELLRHVLDNRPLDRLINTHLHSDHCGGNATLQSRYACQTLIPVAEAQAVRNWDQSLLSFLDTGQPCPRFSYDGVLQPGDSLRMAALEWQVLAAPGHDPHSLILYAPAEKILISADALWQNGFGIIFPELEGASGFAEQAAVLDLIEVLDIRLVIPGHGAPFGDVAAAISRARSRLAYMTADPVRHTRYALKALIAFWLLDVRQISLADIEKRIRASRLMALAAAQFGQPLPALVRRMAEELSASGTASLEHEMLHSRA